jgi:DNA-binding MarR family transcriptional regulator
MAETRQRILEDIADDILDSVPILLHGVMRKDPGQSSRRIDPSRFVLRAVLKHGPVRMSEIGKHMGASKPYMTHLVNKLIADGFVERIPDPNDRRVVNVTITEEGRKAVKAFMKQVRTNVMRNLSSLDPKDISSLRESMRLIRGVAAKLERGRTERAHEHGL